MEKKSSLFEWKGCVVLLMTFFFTLTLFYSYTYDFFYSLVGALFSAGLAWGGYLIIRMIILAARD